MDKKPDFTMDVRINGTMVTVEFEPIDRSIKETEEAAQLFYQKIIRDFSAIDCRGFVRESSGKYLQN